MKFVANFMQILCNIDEAFKECRVANQQQDLSLSRGLQAWVLTCKALKAKPKLCAVQGKIATVVVPHLALLFRQHKNVPKTHPGFHSGEASAVSL